MTSYTQGSVLFGASDGTITQDNANFFWDDTNFRLGIGTTTPALAIDALNASGTTQGRLTFGTTGFSSQYRWSNDGAASSLNLVKGRGTHAAPLAVQQYDEIGAYVFEAYGSSTGIAKVANLTAIVIEPSPSPTAMGGRLTISVSPLGGTNNDEIARFEIATGMSINGANPVIDYNRFHVFRGLTYAALTAFGTVNPYSKAFVTDSTVGLAAGLGNTPVGGGTNKVPVYTVDGTNWLIG